MDDDVAMTDDLAVVTATEPAKLKNPTKKKPAKPKKPKPKRSAKAIGNGEAEKPTKASPPEPPPMPSVHDFRRAANLLKQAADPTRLTVLSILRDEPMNVTDICQELTNSQPAVSHHLALLRHGGLIEPERRSKHNFYSLTAKGRALIDGLIDMIVVK